MEGLLVWKFKFPTCFNFDDNRKINNIKNLFGRWLNSQQLRDSDSGSATMVYQFFSKLKHFENLSFHLNSRYVFLADIKYFDLLKNLFGELRIYN